MTKKEASDALYLENPDTNHVELVHGEDVEAKKGSGWKEPEGKKANGEDWNGEESLGQRNAAADQAKTRAKIDADKAEVKAKEQADAEKSAEKARKDAPPPSPDLTVQVVDTKAAKAK